MGGLVASDLVLAKAIKIVPHTRTDEWIGAIFCAFIGYSIVLSAIKMDALDYAREKYGYEDWDDDD